MTTKFIVFMISTSVGISTAIGLLWSIIYLWYDRNLQTIYSVKSNRKLPHTLCKQLAKREN
jgi:hypothetical protein